LGFRNPTKGSRSGSGATRRNTFLRWRGTDYDEIEFYWDHLNRAKVRLEFMVSRVVFPPKGSHPALRAVSFGVMRSWRLPFGPPISDWFGPWMDPEAAAARINRRIETLDDYMKRGMNGPLILASDPRLGGVDLAEGRLLYWDIQGDPWRDPQSDLAQNSSTNAGPLKDGHSVHGQNSMNLG